MINFFLLSVLTVLATVSSFGQLNSKIEIPTFSDKYSNLVKQLENGKTDIDYREFRESFIESEQFKIYSLQKTRFDSLQKAMYLQIDKKDYQAVIQVTKKMLSINYTSLLAHKILRQTYKIVDDTINATKYKTIQFGLLNSIVKSGDGKTCSTAWHVIDVSEEYFILQILGADLLKQSIDNKEGICDKMEVKTEEGDKKTYYFETSKVFEGYKKLGL